jgi:hypothetical protein
MSCGALLIKDNLRKRNWQGDPSCVFCDCVETIAHLFFQCPVAKVVWSVIARCFEANNIPSNFQQCWSWCKRWFCFGKKFHGWGIAALCWAIWKSHNKACFEKISLKSPLEILCHASALMIFWAGLYGEMDRDQLIEEANLMLKVAKELLAKQTTRQVNQMLLLQDQDDVTNDYSA